MKTTKYIEYIEAYTAKSIFAGIYPMSKKLVLCRRLATWVFIITPTIIIFIGFWWLSKYENLIRHIVIGIF